MIVSAKDYTANKIVEGKDIAIEKMANIQLEFNFIKCGK